VPALELNRALEILPECFLERCYGPEPAIDPLNTVLFPQRNMHNYLTHLAALSPYPNITMEDQCLNCGRLSFFVFRDTIKDVVVTFCSEKCSKSHKNRRLVRIVVLLQRPQWPCDDDSSSDEDSKSEFSPTDYTGEEDRGEE